ncbi:MAG TPA: single-stranded DNA-binding protein [Polyangia bacterium]|jgi:single-strand DNA-binding protein|nr:single-stranded DNA-binding protein [Polyangia bacterium]
MASVNKVILIGNLGANPELKYLPSGQPVCEIRLATNEVFNDQQGQRQERTEWHRVVVYGKQAENCNQYLTKGRPCYIEGRLRTRSWDDKDGNKRYTTEIVAERVQFLGGGMGQDRGQGMPDEGGPPPSRPPRPMQSGGAPRRSGMGGPSAPAEEPPPAADYGGGFGQGGTDDDIPF